MMRLVILTYDPCTSKNVFMLYTETMGFEPLILQGCLVTMRSYFPERWRGSCDTVDSPQPLVRFARRLNATRLRKECTGLSQKGIKQLLSHSGSRRVALN